MKNMITKFLLTFNYYDAIRIYTPNQFTLLIFLFLVIILIIVFIFLYHLHGTGVKNYLFSSMTRKNILKMKLVKLLIKILIEFIIYFFPYNLPLLDSVITSLLFKLILLLLNLIPNHFKVINTLTNILLQIIPNRPIIFLDNNLFNKTEDLGYTNYNFPNFNKLFSRRDIPLLSEDQLSESEKIEDFIIVDGKKIRDKGGIVKLEDGVDFSNGYDLKWTKFMFDNKLDFCSYMIDNPRNRGQLPQHMRKSTVICRNHYPFSYLNKVFNPNLDLKKRYTNIIPNEFKSHYRKINKNLHIHKLSNVQYRCTYLINFKFFHKLEQILLKNFKSDSNKNKLSHSVLEKFQDKLRNRLCKKFKLDYLSTSLLGLIISIFIKKTLFSIPSYDHNNTTLKELEIHCKDLLSRLDTDYIHLVKRQVSEDFYKFATPEYLMGLFKNVSNLKNFKDSKSEIWYFLLSYSLSFSIFVSKRLSISILFNKRPSNWGKKFIARKSGIKLNVRYYKPSMDIDSLKNTLNLVKSEVLFINCFHNILNSNLEFFNNLFIGKFTYVFSDYLKCFVWGYFQSELCFNNYKSKEDYRVKQNLKSIRMFRKMNWVYEEKWDFQTGLVDFYEESCFNLNRGDEDSLDTSRQARRRVSVKESLKSSFLLLNIVFDPYSYNPKLTCSNYCVSNFKIVAYLHLRGTYSLINLTSGDKKNVNFSISSLYPLGMELEILDFRMEMCKLGDSYKFDLFFRGNENFPYIKDSCINSKFFGKDRPYSDSSCLDSYAEEVEYNPNSKYLRKNFDYSKDVRLVENNVSNIDFLSTNFIGLIIHTFIFNNDPIPVPHLMIKLKEVLHVLSLNKTKFEDIVIILNGDPISLFLYQEMLIHYVFISKINNLYSFKFRERHFMVILSFSLEGLISIYNDYLDLHNSEINKSKYLEFYFLHYKKLLILISRSVNSLELLNSAYGWAAHYWKVFAPYIKTDDEVMNKKPGCRYMTERVYDEFFMESTWVNRLPRRRYDQEREDIINPKEKEEADKDKDGG